MPIAAVTGARHSATTPPCAGANGRRSCALPGGKQLGILGRGLAIAKRAANGFDMSVSYHNRQHRSDVDYTCSRP
jgi:lactate dehydrogenase-like 2-hydroxyacid dehydrogenase